MARRKKAAVVSAGDGEDAKSAALTAALRQIESSFGKGAVMKLGERPNQSIDVIPTGSLAVDVALGIGGLPRGRVVEIYGPESCGKTTLALNVIAEAQKLGGKCCFIDAEHALDPSWARKLGVDTDELFISQPDSGEAALEIADTLVRSASMDVVVVDSVAALVPRAEAEGEMGDAHMALQARLMSQALRKLTGSLSRANTLIIFINQIRSKVGVIFGSPEVTAGGNALKYYASVRIDIRRKTPIKQGDLIMGYETRVKVTKNKLAPPFREADFDMMFGEGISRTGELINVGVTQGILKKSGAWIGFTAKASELSEGVLEEGNFAQGKEKAKAVLASNPDIADVLEQVIRASLVAVPAEEEEEESSAVEEE